MTEWLPAPIERTLRQATARAGAADWSAMLDDLDAEIVRLRTSGARWTPICWQLGISRATAHRHYKAALLRIATKLDYEPATRACLVQHDNEE
jgi:hypothetical protein